MARISSTNAQATRGVRWPGTSCLGRPSLNWCSSPSVRLSVKGCGVCGGNVRPLDGQSGFGYCENCGIVYALGGRLTGARDTGRQGLGSGTGGAKGRDTFSGFSVISARAPPQSPGSYWRCPDCETEIRSENDSDLEFAKREHVREYHPNRSTA